MANTSVVDERRIRRILKEAEDRFDNELLPDEERLLLLDRIRRLRRASRLPHRLLTPNTPASTSCEVRTVGAPALSLGIAADRGLEASPNRRYSRIAEKTSSRKLSFR